jgi:hypothetical protein
LPVGVPIGSGNIPVAIFHDLQKYFLQITALSKNAVYLSFPSNYLDVSKIISIFAKKCNDDRKGQVL